MNMREIFGLPIDGPEKEMPAPKGAEWLADIPHSDSNAIIRYLNELKEKHEAEAKEAERRQKRHNWILGVACALLGALLPRRLRFFPFISSEFPCRVKHR